MFPCIMVIIRWRKGSKKGKLGSLAHILDSERHASKSAKLMLPTAGILCVFEPRPGHQGGDILCLPAIL